MEALLVAAAALATAVAGALKAFWPQITRSDSTTTSEVVDSDVLSRFLELTERLALVEADLKVTQRKLDEALQRIDELQKVESYLEARLHEKDKEIVSLNAERTVLISRVQHLEDVVRREGLNGDILTDRRKPPGGTNPGG